MIRRAGLHQHFAGLLAAAGPSRHLHQELEGALGGAEVGQVQGHVGVEHADERDVRKIEALGDHLRAEEHVGLSP